MPSTAIAHSMRLRSAAAAALLLLLAGWENCPGSAPPQKPAADTAPARVWPSPPAEPRISFVQSISRAADLGMRTSGWSRLANLVTGNNRDQENLVKPCGIALDESDNLCLTDTGTGRVWFFDLGKKRAQSWDKVGKFTFASPVSIAKRKYRLYVADSALQKVVAFDTAGKFLFAIDQTNGRPAGLAASNDRLFVADSAMHRILVYSLTGEPVQQWGKRGAAPGELNFPTHLAVNDQGQLWVTDAMNARVQLFDAAGASLSIVGSAGDSSGHLNRPKGVAVDRFGHVYVVDALFDNFQIFSAQDGFLLAVGSPGSEPGQFWMPAGIAIDRKDRIYVSDSYNGRIQVFQYLNKP